MHFTLKGVEVLQSPARERLVRQHDAAHFVAPDKTIYI